MVEILTDIDKKIKKYDSAFDTRKFEIELYWKRSLFFWGFIAAAFIALAGITRENSSYYLKMVISIFGVVSSLCWALVNRGSKYWQENWEEHIGEIENDVTGQLFNNRKKVQKKFFLFRASKYSVSKVTISLSYFTTFLWCGLTFYYFDKILLHLSIHRGWTFFDNVFNNYKIIYIIYFLILVIVWIIIIILGCKSEFNNSTNE